MTLALFNEEPGTSRKIFSDPKFETQILDIRSFAKFNNVKGLNEVLEKIGLAAVLECDEDADEEQAEAVAEARAKATDLGLGDTPMPALDVLNVVCTLIANDRYELLNELLLGEHTGSLPAVITKPCKDLVVEMDDC